jgi:hypothetical protein
MLYDEAAFFDNNACQHVADWYNVQRIKRINAELERIRRRQPSNRLLSRRSF